MCRYLKSSYKEGCHRKTEMRQLSYKLRYKAHKTSSTAALSFQRVAEDTVVEASRTTLHTRGGGEEKQRELKKQGCKQTNYLKCSATCATALKWPTN